MINNMQPQNYMYGQQMQSYQSPEWQRPTINPYLRGFPQPSQPTGLPGKYIQTLNDVVVSEVPQDGSVAFGMNSGNKNYTPSRHGMAYDNYQTARRYYTENPSEENKMHMKASWDDAVDDAIQALKKMYMEAEPTMKRKVNEKVSRALQEMPPA